MNWQAILAAALRAQAVYIEDHDEAKAAFEKLGYTFLGQYRNLNHQAVLSCDGKGAVYLSISGTRFSQGNIESAADLFEDVELLPLEVSPGAYVTKGAFNGLDAMWAWAKSIVPAGTVFTVEGHSLGAWRTRYTGSFLPPEQIAALYSFESPKGGNDAYWLTQKPAISKLTSVINGRDVFVAWPLLGWRHPNQQVIWLQYSGFTVIDPHTWAGPMSIEDHDIDLVVDRLNKIAT